MKSTINMAKPELKKLLQFLQDNILEMQGVINTLQDLVENANAPVKTVAFHPRDEKGHFLPKRLIAYFRYDREGMESTWREVMVDEVKSTGDRLCGNDAFRNGGYRCFKRDSMANVTMEVQFVKIDQDSGMFEVVK